MTHPHRTSKQRTCFAEPPCAAPNFPLIIRYFAHIAGWRRRCKWRRLLRKPCSWGGGQRRGSTTDQKSSTIKVDAHNSSSDRQGQTHRVAGSVAVAARNGRAQGRLRQIKASSLVTATIDLGRRHHNRRVAGAREVNRWPSEKLVNLTGPSGPSSEDGIVRRCDIEAQLARGSFRGAEANRIGQRHGVYALLGVPGRGVDGHGADQGRLRRR